MSPGVVTGNVMSALPVPPTKKSLGLKPEISFVKSVILGATLLALLLSGGYLRREHLESPEYFALMLCSATGMMLMA